MKKTQILIFLALVINIKANAQITEPKPETLNYKPFVWQSETEED